MKVEVMGIVQFGGVRELTRSGLHGLPKACPSLWAWARTIRRKSSLPIIQLGFVKPHRLSLASTSAAHFTDQKRRIRAACRCGVRLRGLVDVDITFTTFRHSATRAIAAGVPGPATRSRAREHELDQRRAAK